MLFRSNDPIRKFECPAKTALLKLADRVIAAAQASPAAIIPTMEPGQPVVPLVINPDVLDEQNLLIATLSPITGLPKCF